MSNKLLTFPPGLPEELPVVFLVSWIENLNVFGKNVFYSQPALGCDFKITHS